MDMVMRSTRAPRKYIVVRPSISDNLASSLQFYSNGLLLRTIRWPFTASRLLFCVPRQVFVFNVFTDMQVWTRIKRPLSIWSPGTNKLGVTIHDNSQTFHYLRGIQLDIITVAVQTVLYCKDSVRVSTKSNNVLACRISVVLQDVPKPMFVLNPKYLSYSTCGVIVINPHVYLQIYLKKSDLGTMSKVNATYFEATRYGTDGGQEHQDTN